MAHEFLGGSGGYAGTGEHGAKGVAQGASVEVPNDLKGTFTVKLIWDIAPFKMIIKDVKIEIPAIFNQKHKPKFQYNPKKN